ncbi:MAG: hypothetical protein KJ872_11585 [Alphaproteobacteria bacterium]|nr:hypothetical protein [Alphaproteobacteria bacterium]
MTTYKAALSEQPDLPHIITILENQLAALDRMGAHIGAAHLDAAIQHLRLAQTRNQCYKLNTRKSEP